MKNVKGTHNELFKPPICKYNRTFVKSRFDSKIIFFYGSYFPYNRKDKQFEYNFLIICKKKKLQL